jgi:hypothetical protein
MDWIPEAIGPYSSSPVAAEGKIFPGSEDGNSALWRTYLSAQRRGSLQFRER